MSEPRWLDDHEAHAWRALLWMTHAIDRTLDHQLQRDSQIPHGTYQILVVLSVSEEQTLPMGVLANSLGWSQSRLSHAVARMEKTGWVRRIPSSTDKRSNLAQLTEDGRRKLVEAAPGHVAAARDLVIDALDPEQLRVLVRISETVLDRAAVMLGEDLPFKPFDHSMD
ncbi:MAG: MarR family transcriptional regulator [Umezawaea sp.]